MTAQKNIWKWEKEVLLIQRILLELLMYRVRGGDKTLKNHLQNSLENTKYTSLDIKNELINCCKDIIVEQRVGYVKENRYFSG